MSTPPAASPLESTEGLRAVTTEGVEHVYHAVIAGIDGMAWEDIDSDEVMRVAKAYYYFSIQFRENLEIACNLYPDDKKLKQLTEEECNTANLSPWPGVARRGERMNHDEFMRRLIWLHPEAARDGGLTTAGLTYLTKCRITNNLARACSIASYEDGGLAKVFMAMLRSKGWDGRGNRAFRHFLVSHLRFDGDHGVLARHLPVDDKILPLWIAFRDLLMYAVPKLIA
jgi:hypothetical protein